MPEFEQGEQLRNGRHTCHSTGRNRNYRKNNNSTETNYSAERKSNTAGNRGETFNSMDMRRAGFSRGRGTRQCLGRQNRSRSGN
jgi:hypothetical protein